MLKSYDWISSPVQKINGEINVPGDKSISHRAIILGSIAKGSSIITRFANGVDCMNTINAFRSMNVDIEIFPDHKILVHGVGKYGLDKPISPIDCGNSGTAMRLLMGLLVGQKFDSSLIGDFSLNKRPMERIAIPLRLMGAQITTTKGTAPIDIRAVKSLVAIEYSMPYASAQLKSALLLAGLYALGEMRIHADKSIRDHSERLIEYFSIKRKKYNIDIPGDLSAAAFLIVSALLIPDSDILIRNVGVNPTRMGVIHILKAMGASIDILNYNDNNYEPIADLRIKHSQLRGINIPLELVPSAMDEFPIIFIAASKAQGTTILRGAQELRYKESDRIFAMVQGLKALGVKVNELIDGVEIEGSMHFESAHIDSYFDHRVAMSFAVAGSVAKERITIKNAHMVETSFPNFIDLANSLGMNIVKKTNIL